ncbi:hypothetical protein BDN72DRAFT_904886 [Pluteus cervinus]|uniref:Uncharacterized protein n=1 Tax=Pluteus cervinus TaxID=181527 RepID=A0ACD3A4E2_9AGAR|nr:hypothetical protein BDN72DRAFT_904886 [Pluteus cervinus]
MIPSAVPACPLCENSWARRDNTRRAIRDPYRYPTGFIPFFKRTPKSLKPPKPPMNIKHLPDQILLRIIELAVMPTSDNLSLTYSLSNPDLRYDLTAIYLSRINRYWRSLLYSSPVPWSYLIVNIPNAHSLDGVTFYLNKSSRNPFLDVVLVDPHGRTDRASTFGYEHTLVEAKQMETTRKILQRLASPDVSTRLRRIYIEVDLIQVYYDELLQLSKCSFPLLESLQIVPHVTLDPSGYYSIMRNFMKRGCRLPWECYGWMPEPDDPDALTLFMGTEFTHLVFENLEYQFVWTVLYRCLRLESLQVRGMSSEGVRVLPDEPSTYESELCLQLPQLHTLRICCCIRISPILTRISAPNLRDLWYNQKSAAGNADEAMARCLQDFLRRSQCQRTLQHLHIGGFVTTPGFVVYFKLAQPYFVRLERLTLNFMSITAPALKVIVPRNPNGGLTEVPFPSLLRLNLSACEVKDGLVLEMIEDRAKMNAPMPDILSYVKSLAGHQKDLRGLHRCVGHDGLKVDLIVNPFGEDGFISVHHGFEM